MKLATALSAITAAVVGVILNLAVWFGLHVLFPDGRGLDGFALFVSVFAFVGMIRRKMGCYSGRPGRERRRTHLQDVLG